MKSTLYVWKVCCLHEYKSFFKSVTFKRKKVHWNCQYIKQKTRICILNVSLRASEVKTYIKCLKIKFIIYLFWYLLFAYIEISCMFILDVYFSLIGAIFCEQDNTKFSIFFIIINHMLTLCQTHKECICLCYNLL